MILTVTLNPSVDIRYNLEHFELDAVNRVNNVSRTAGGKGLNVSRVLVQLGEEVAATGFLGGSLGEFIRAQIKELSIQDRFVASRGNTRNCIAVIHEGQQTEILESGPEIDLTEAQEFLDQFKNFSKEAEIITVSGSLPRGLKTDFYGEILEVAHATGSKILLDSSGEALKRALGCAHKPYLIKPNQEELAGLVNQDIRTEQDVMDALRDPMLQDIPWIVVTLGGQGALVRSGETVYRVCIPKVEVKNPVGSGDSVVAGFASAFSRKLSNMDTIKHGVAMGVLNAMEEKTGNIDPEQVDWCINRIQVEQLD